MPDESPTPDNEPKGTAKSPFAGCAILIVATVMMVALVGWALWTLRFQEGEIAKFTQEDAAPVPTYSVEKNADALNGLAAKFKVFQDALAAKEKAELSLTAKDLNLAIAQYEELKDFRETFFVREIKDELLHVDISYKLGDAPFSGRKNYLNGKMTAKVELVPREVILRIQNMDVPEGDIPKEFLTELSTHRIMEVYKEHETLGPIMKALTSVSIEGGQVIARVTPGENPPSELPEDMEPKIQRFLTLIGVIATVFLAVVAFLLVFASKKSKKQIDPASKDAQDA